MNKRVFVSFALLALLLAVIIPLWAFSKNGSSSSSPQAVASSDEHARNLFATNCGTCHTLEKAGTDGIVGPNLDDRLAGTVGPATDEASIQASQDRVLNAILNGLGEGAMPAGILQGQQAEEVANFVARAAGQ